MSASVLLSRVVARLDYLLGSSAPVKWGDDDARENAHQLRPELHSVVERLGSVSDPNLRNALNKQAIQLAYDIENVVECQAVGEDMSSRSSGRGGGGGRGGGIKYLVLNRCLGRPDHRPLNELRSLKKRIDELLKLCLDGHTATAGAETEAVAAEEEEEATSTSNYTSSAIAIPPPQSDSSDQYIVAREEEMDILLSMLFEDRPLSPIAIFGMPGIGKTTLARQVFNNPAVVRYFDSRAWAFVTQDFQARDVLATILVSLSPDQSRDQIARMELTELTAQLYKVQKGRRCLIVLDDIWSMEPWEIMRFAFPKDSGTRILITTRMEQVAHQWNGRVHQVSLLTQSESQELFLRESGLRNSDIRKNPQIQDYVNKILTICQGLPLASTTIASVLKTKKLEDWDEVLHDLLLPKDMHERMSDILGLSYNHLPHHAKPCLTYLGQFPPDQLILAEKIYLLWMAEGLISDRKMGEKYLSDLVDRNLVMMRKEEHSAETGLISCELQDMIREFCIWKGQEEDFFGIIDPSYGRQRTTLMPRVAIYLGGQIGVNGVSSYIPMAKNIRSLLFFGKDKSPLKLTRPQEEIDLEAFQWTRVLDFDQIDFQGANLPKNIDKLVYLRYLGFQGCYFEEFPLSYCNFPYLETLDLRVVTSCKMTIPNIPWQMPNLRHLYFPEVFQVHSQSKLKLVTLTSLEILENFNADTCDADDLTKLKHLQTFTGTADGNTKDFMKIINFLDASEHLRYSSVIFKNFDCYSKERRGLLKNILECDALHVLHLEGHLKRMPQNLSIARKLTKIILDGSEFQEDPMPILGRFEHLESLVLCNDAFVRKDITCSDSSFLRLRSLKLANLRFFEKWELEFGAMPRLSILTVERCDKLLMLPDDLMEIPTLTELRMGSMPKVFEEKVRKLGDEQIEYGNDELTLTFYDC